MLEIGSFLEKFNTINSQLIQYWWYWFCTVSMCCILTINALLSVSMFNAVRMGIAGGSGIVLPLVWVISILAIILIVLPVSGLFHFLQQLLPIGKVIISNPTIIFYQKVISAFLQVINLFSIFVIVLYIIWLCAPKH